MTWRMRSPTPSKGVYGFVGRGLKNANVVLYDDILLGWDQETVTADGKKLLTDTPAAIEAGKWYQTIMKECGPPGMIGFNWNECQTTFMQGRGAMWWDGIGFSAPLLDPTKSRVVDTVGFAPGSGRPEVAQLRHLHRRHRHSRRREEQEGRVAVPAMGHRQADAGRACSRTGSGTPPRLSVLRARRTSSRAAGSRRNGSTRRRHSLKMARSGLPVIVPVTEFRDTIGAGAHQHRRRRGCGERS